MQSQCAGLSTILLILERLRRLLPGLKLDSVENALTAFFLELNTHVGIPIDSTTMFPTLGFACFPREFPCCTLLNSD
eukprot:SAG25_NODE_8234_length_431_cov_0.939940_1_plen_77_part_00